ncbi:hypothetical protein L208DRAFT_365641 [Tricholoma matsutake]|nr:hypothetical protein L208DRAFT_365641 [Tricholoma matsutake 945]
MTLASLLAGKRLAISLLHLCIGVLYPTLYLVQCSLSLSNLMLCQQSGSNRWNQPFLMQRLEVDSWKSRIDPLAGQE